VVVLRRADAELAGCDAPALRAGVEGHPMTSANWGTKVGLLTPATNLTVESELCAMAVDGVTVATARIVIDQIKWVTPDDLRRFVEGVSEQVPATTERVMQARPDILLLGISSSPLWGGLTGNDALKARAKTDTGLDLVTPVDAIRTALDVLRATKVGVVTPYPELADNKVVEFFTELGVRVVSQHSLRCKSAQDIGEVPPVDIIKAFRAARVPEADVLVQLGTDLKTAAVAAQAEDWLGLPVLAVNTTTWWHTLRAAGSNARLPGWGALLRDH
jgi:maleate isomerase